MLRLQDDYRLRALRSPSDMPSIERIWANAFEGTWPIATERLGEILAGQNRANRGWCDVVVHHEPIGIIAYQQRQQSLTEGAIVLVLIDPEHQRKRIGSVLVQTALERLRRQGVVSVELGNWSHPQFWHGLPLDCVAAKEFFGALGWRYGGENADLVVDLATFVTPQSFIEKTRAAHTSFRTAKADDQDRVLEFVRGEFDSFAPYYVDELRSNGPGNIHIGETDARINAAIISSTPPHCPGAQWQQLLGSQMSAMGALLVRSEARRRGIGLGLCAYTLERLKRAGFESCYLEWATLTHMYEQLGAYVWRRYVQGKLDL